MSLSADLSVIDTSALRGVSSLVLLPIVSEPAANAGVRQAPGLELALAEKPDPDLARSVLERRVVNFYLQDTCPVRCDGCAAAPVDGSPTSAKASKSANYRDILGFLDYAKGLGVKLKLNFIGDFDPAFLKFADAKDKSFADVLKHAVDGGHTILFPIASTGSWDTKGPSFDATTRLAELDCSYRASQGADGKTASSYFILSMPRRNSGMFNTKFAADTDGGIARYIEMTLRNISLLAKNGPLKVNVNYNDRSFPGDRDVAAEILRSIEKQLPVELKQKVELRLVPFVGDESAPDCCKIQSNWLQVSRDGFRVVKSTSSAGDDRLHWASNPMGLKGAIDALSQLIST